jgi:omega-amidase
MQPLTVTVIQTDIFWENKTENLRMLEEKIKSIPERTELVILPEMFSTGFSMNTEYLAEDLGGETVEWMKRIATEQRIIITGSIIIKEKGSFHNRLVWMLPNGDYGFYDKRHLFAYGKEDEFYTAGNKRLIAQVKGWKINLQVCYDLRFPVWARNKMDEAGAAEFDLLIYVANWPARRSHAWKTLLCARAIENQCYVIGVNRVGEDAKGLSYTGNSMIIDPLGEVLYHHADTEDIFTVTLDKEHLDQTRKAFPFLKDADDFDLKN